MFRSANKETFQKKNNIVNTMLAIAFRKKNEKKKKLNELKASE
jgi:hypothetical protein